MSSLLPIVNILKDKCVEDLRTENEALKKRLRQTQLVEVTGPNRHPIYASVPLELGCYTSFIGDQWAVDLSVCTRKACPLRSFEDVEIWLGGILFLSFSKDTSQHLQGEDLHDDGYMTFKFARSLTSVDVELPEDLIEELNGRLDANVENMCFHLSELGQSMRTSAMLFDSIHFDMNEIGKCFDQVQVPMQAKWEQFRDEFDYWLEDITYLHIGPPTEDAESRLCAIREISSKHFDRHTYVRVNDTDFRNLIEQFVQPETMKMDYEDYFNELERAIQGLCSQTPCSYEKERSLMRRWLESSG